MSDYWQDVGGQRPDTWAGVIDNKCPECGAEPSQKCWNKLSDKPKRLPCIKRLRVVA